MRKYGLLLFLFCGLLMLTACGSQERASEPELSGSQSSQTAVAQEELASVEEEQEKLPVEQEDSALSESSVPGPPEPEYGSDDGIEAVGVQVTCRTLTAAAMESFYDTGLAGAVDSCLAELTPVSQAPENEKPVAELVMLYSLSGEQRTLELVESGEELYVREGDQWYVPSAELRKLVEPLLPELPEAPDSLTVQQLEQTEHFLLRERSLRSWREQVIWQPEEVAQISGWLEEREPASPQGEPESGRVIEIIWVQDGQETQYSLQPDSGLLCIGKDRFELSSDACAGLDALV